MCPAKQEKKKKRTGEMSKIQSFYDGKSTATKNSPEGNLNAKYIPREYVEKGDLSLNVDLLFIFEGLLPK